MDKKRLNDATIVKYAQRTAFKLGIPMPEILYLREKMSLTVPQPVILSNSKYQLWIDRYYIAYSEIDEDSIMYVYLSKHHINEEIHNFIIAAKKWNVKASLPDSICVPFTKALKYMNSSNTDYFIDRAFFADMSEKVNKSPEMSKLMMLKW